MKDLKVLHFNNDDKEETSVEHTNLFQVQNIRLTNFEDEMTDFDETSSLKLDHAHLCLMPLLREAKLEKNEANNVKRAKQNAQDKNWVIEN